MATTQKIAAMRQVARQLEEVLHRLDDEDIIVAIRIDEARLQVLQWLQTAQRLDAD